MNERHEKDLCLKIEGDIDQVFDAKVSAAVLAVKSQRDDGQVRRIEMSVADVDLSSDETQQEIVRNIRSQIHIDNRFNAHARLSP